ncbi:MAG: hypothetical protein M3R60_14350, partial [Pseudomonadota bacterium]|nr:hypothetical protein [Pseudomonadota bacterium]
PLLYMYKAARLAGVPLKLEFANDIAKRRFKVEPATIEALNAYLAASPTKQGALTAIMREQAKQYIQWRLSRRVEGINPMEKSGSFARASVFDQNDLHSANREFDSEVAAFESWLAKKGKDFSPKPQVAGFANEHEKEWEQIATWWRKATLPPQAVSRFFDEYVHDSRAWFKLIPGNPDNEKELHVLLKKQVAMLEEEREHNARKEKMIRQNKKDAFRLIGGRKQDASSPQYTPPPSAFSEAQTKALDEYAKDNKIPRMLTEGREPFELVGIAGRAGYLRFRKVYGGRDSVLISDASADGERARLRA